MTWHCVTAACQYHEKHPVAGYDGQPVRAAWHFLEANAELASGGGVRGRQRAQESFRLAAEAGFASNAVGPPGVAGEAQDSLWGQKPRLAFAKLGARPPLAPPDTCHTTNIYPHARTHTDTDAQHTRASTHIAASPLRGCRPSLLLLVGI